jgi:hypothetical protein
MDLKDKIHSDQWFKSCHTHELLGLPLLNMHVPQRENLLPFNSEEGNRCKKGL